MEGGGGRGRWRRRGAVASAWDDGVVWRRRPESRTTTEAPARWWGRVADVLEGGGVEVLAAAGEWAARGVEAGWEGDR